MITINDVLLQGTRLLKKNTDSQSPYLDALLLMAQALKKSKEQVLASLNEPIWEIDALSFGKTIDMRSRGMPIAYIIRRKEFYGLEFYVDNRVLIPRPDTELLVEKAVERALETPETSGSLLDLCTGCGCIGIAFAHTMEASHPDASWEVSLADISSEALAVSAVNARSILGRELPAVCSDLFEKIDRTFDLIVTNPPYLTDRECGTSEIRRRREPIIALKSGPDGFDHIRRIVSEAASRLNPGGTLMIEGGFDQAEQTEKLMKQAGFAQTAVHQDLSGHNRVVSGTRGQ